MSWWDKASASERRSLIDSGRFHADGSPKNPVCNCDPPRFVNPKCAIHGAHEYHGAPDPPEADNAR